MCIWQESKPTHGVCVCVCFYICVLIDEMNSGSGKLILAEADLSLSFSSLASLLVCCLCSPIYPQSSHPDHNLVLLTCFFSLKLKVDLKKCLQWWWWGNTSKLGYLVLSVLFYRTICLLTQVKVLDHLLFFTCTWKPNNLSLRISATFLIICNCTFPK